MKKITIGARGSKLSLAYVAKVKDLLLKKNLNLTFRPYMVQKLNALAAR